MSAIEIDALKASLQKERKESMAAVQKQRRAEKSRNYWMKEAERLQAELDLALLEIDNLRKTGVVAFMSQIRKDDLLNEIRRRMKGQ